MAIARVLFTLTRELDYASSYNTQAMYEFLE